MYYRHIREKLLFSENTSDRINRYAACVALSEQYIYRDIILSFYFFPARLKHIFIGRDNPIFTVRNRIYRADIDFILCCRKPRYSAKMCCPTSSELEVIVFIEHTDILCRVVRFLQFFRFVIIIEFIASEKCRFVFRFGIFLFGRYLPNDGR